MDSARLLRIHSLLEVGELALVSVRIADEQLAYTDDAVIDEHGAWIGLTRRDGERSQRIELVASLEEALSLLDERCVGLRDQLRGRPAALATALAVAQSGGRAITEHALWDDFPLRGSDRSARDFSPPQIQGSQLVFYTVHLALDDTPAIVRRHRFDLDAFRLVETLGVLGDGATEAAVAEQVPQA